MSDKVYLFTFWKSAIKFDGTMPDTKLIAKNNDILYNIIKDRFGTFPMNVSDFEKIEKEIIDLCNQINDVIMVFLYSDGNQKFFMNSKDQNTETIAKYIEIIIKYLSFDNQDNFKVIIDKVAKRHS